MKVFEVTQKEVDQRSHIRDYLPEQDIGKWAVETKSSITTFTNEKHAREFAMYIVNTSGR
jgi:hypothetical protein